MFIVIMTKQQPKVLSLANKNMVIAAGMAALLVFCLAGALWTAYWSLRFGLAPRPPLSVFQIFYSFPGGDTGVTSLLAAP